MRIAKGNLYRDIPQEKLSRYLNDGWEQVGKDGKRLKEKPDKQTDKQIADLTAKLAEAEVYAEKADKQIADLTAKLAELTEKK